MVKGKYVIGCRGTRDLFAVVFGQVTEHNFIGRRIFMEPTHIVSAGFFSVKVNEDHEPCVTTHGSSESLNISGTVYDQSFIEVALGLREYPDTAHRRKLLQMLEAKRQAASGNLRLYSE